MKPKAILIALGLNLLAQSPLPARSIDWGNAALDSLFYSNGSSLDDSMIFELGSFGSIFVPTEFNMELWSANWHVFDRASVGNGWNSTDSFFSSSANLTVGGTSNESPPLPSYVFAQGEQAYIWAFKTDQIFAPGLEWALVTNNNSDGNSLDNWTFPAHSDQTSLPLDWRLSTASTPVFGGLNSVDGPGDSTLPTSFALQTQTVTIPEPSSALLIMIAGLVFRFRTHRNYLMAVLPRQ